MKLKVFDRVVNGLLLLALLGLCGLLVAVAWGALPTYWLTGFVTWLGSGWVAAAIVSAVGLLLLIFVLRILFVRQRSKAEAAPAGVLVRGGENGAVYLTLSALEDIVLRFVRADTRVREARCDIAPRAGAVGLRVVVNLVGDANIPEVSAELQDKLKAHVETLTGIVVFEVQIIVEKQASAATEPLPLLPANRVK